MTYPIAPEVERELQGTPELEELRRKAEAEKRSKYPEPTLDDILEMRERHRLDFQQYHDQIRSNRQLRYLQDVLPEKWQRHLQDGRRFYSRRTHNEIMRVVATQCRNSPKFKVPPAGSTQKARDAADKESRWLNQLLPALSRKAGHEIRWQWVDSQNESGIAAYEVFLTGAYDDIDTEPREVEGREETPKEILDRTEAQMLASGMPFGVRIPDPLTLTWDEDEDGPCAALIVEEKSYRQVYRRLTEKLGSEKIQELRLPKPGDRGRPRDQHSGAKEQSHNDNVETIRYYDRCWYAYIVAGEIVEGPVMHGLPGLPIVIGYGMLTSSPNLAERLQGITWGMSSIEVATNDIMTKTLDNWYTYGRPIWVIETPGDGRLMVDPTDPTQQPITLDLSEPSVKQLNPGQKLVNALQGYQASLDAPVINVLNAFWQMNGQNPIAQGESPGADPAGYTVNTLTNAAQAVYERNLDNEASALGRLGDFLRRTVKETIREKVYLSAPMADRKRGGTEWLALAPEDVSETPCIVQIDPLSDANRLALRNSLEQGNKGGYVPRSEVQRVGYGADDPEAWDDEIAIDLGVQALAQMAIEEAKNQIFEAQRQEMVASPGGAVNEMGQPVSGPGAEAAMAAQGGPAAIQPPTVGAQQAQASQSFGETRPGPAALNGARATAGQGRGPGVQI